MSLREEIIADFRAAEPTAKRPTLWNAGLMFLRSRGFRAAFLYRLGHRCRCRGMRVLGGLFDRMIVWVSGAEVSTLAEIGPGLTIPHPTGIVIGSKSRLGRNVHILQGVTLGGAGRYAEDGRTSPIVGNDVILGAGAKLVGPVTVGDRARIGANAVVVTDIPPDAVAVGVPAHVVKLAGRRLGLLEQEGEVPLALREILRRIEAIEARLGMPDRQPAGGPVGRQPSNPGELQ